MITLLVNPVAGNGRSKKVAISASNWLKERNIPHCIRETTASGAAKEMVKEIAATYRGDPSDMILSIGGDGTFLEVVQGALESKIPIASLPAGTGNDFLKSLNVPSDPIAALEHIYNAPVREIDVGMLNGELFVNECGAGFDVMVLDYAEKAKKHVRGLLPYLWGVICTIFTYYSSPMIISADGKEVFRDDCLVFSVANGKFIGGGIPISPNAEPTSGKLELLVLKACSRLRLMSYLPGLLRGKILSFRDTVVNCRADTVTVQPADPSKTLRVNIDGEITDMKTCTFSILPRSLSIHM